MNVIEVKGLGKKYRIGKADKQADTLTGALINGLRSPWQNLRNIRNLSRLDRDEDSVAWALRDVSFEVKEGEVLGIIGHNGAGKSTLLKILSRITEPSEGEVRIHGRVAALLEVGTGFHPELTGRENIYMNGTILGMRKKEIDHKLDEIVDFSGVEKYLDTPVKFYSSGMRVRLGFSVAAHLEPEILIIDEVLAVGDAEFQKKCLGKMETVAGQGRTVLFVSHNMTAVKSICKSGMVLRNGQLGYVGKAEQSVNHYLQSFSPSKSVVFDKADPLANSKLVFLKGVRVESSDSHFEQLSIDKPLSVIVEFEIKARQKNIHVNLFFNTSDGNNVFVVSSNPQDVNRGFFEAKCDVPAHFFNDELYSLDVTVVEDSSRSVFKYKSALVIQLNEPARDSAWMGKMPGVVRPQFPFLLQKITSD